MLTDMRPLVERLFKQFLLAGIPVLGVACGKGSGLDVGATGGQQVSAGGGGEGGAIGSGGRVGGTSGAGGKGGAGRVMGGDGGGGDPEDGGTGGAGPFDGGVACAPVHIVHGIVDRCGGDGGTGSVTLPLTHKDLAFDPNDPRWGALYQACVASSATDSCASFCRTLIKAVAPGAFVSTNYVACDVTCGASPTIALDYVSAVCGRRVTDAGAPCASSVPRSLADYLALAAALEAESVPAFKRLREALARHGAPAALVRAARVAMGEEARHWRRTRDLARKHGGKPVKAQVTATPFASIEELALENVVEGCVRETFGALIAARQATEAAEPEVRALMSEIAREELSHAALSWKIDAWACTQLDAGFAARREEAARGALAELLVSAHVDWEPALLRAAGLPDREESHAWLATVWANLWAPNLVVTRA